MTHATPCSLSPPTLVTVLGIAALSSMTHASPSGAKMTLDEVVSKAKQNARITAEAHNVNAQKARASAVRGARYPKVRLTAFLAPSPDIDCDDPDCIRTSPKEVTVDFQGVFGGANLSIIQPAFTFGKLTAASNAATQAVSAAKFQKDSVTSDLVLRAAKAYFGVKLARELVWMLEDGLERIDSALHSLQEKLQQGEEGVTLQDRLRVQTLRAEVEARLIQANAARETSLAGMRALVEDSSALVDDDQLRARPFTLPKTDTEYLAHAKQNRPDLNRARAGVDAVQQLAKLEQAKYWPDLLLIAGLNIARAQGVDNPPSAFADDPFNTTGASLGLVLRWNLDLASQPARVRQSKKEHLRATSLLKAALSLATFEVQSAYAMASGAKKQLVATQKGETAARAWLASVVQADAIGTAEAKDLADAYAAYFTARSRVLQSTYDWNIATIRLQKAVGEYSLPTAVQ